MKEPHVPELTSYGRPPPAYRLPEATRLGRVRLQVADLERSLRYYQDVIGLRVLERNAGWAALGAHGDTHGDDAGLLELHERPGATPMPRRGRLGLYHFAVLLPERAALGRFVRHLASLGVRAGAADHLVSEALYLQDPDGLGIEVYADRPRPAWQVTEQQVLMASDPLDLDGLARSGGAEPWAGTPPGTVIGHVHLHVGDLSEAAAFYHEALGFDVVVWGYPGALFVSAGGYHHHLGLNTWAAGAPVPQPNDARLLEWELVVPHPADADAAAQSLRERGYDTSQEEGTWRATDPWGTSLSLRPDSRA